MSPQYFLDPATGEVHKREEPFVPSPPLVGRLGWVPVVLNPIKERTQ
ncbi:hypothetical protein SEA_SKOG_13 [Gordonia phage Skog]|uniref:Uncharacterized protein n=1 Tax=Gordonia phage Skog TaxID=2704033 RepID=A0A6G6XJZ1_9CAUD|nr:hypothetical protein KHQ85_gp013 [Gordonia phage Skog]QIG58165.1 hypothetical protein SEA_SKOG_13 [Gordonia phage Skog]